MGEERDDISTLRLGEYEEDFWIIDRVVKEFDLSRSEAVRDALYLQYGAGEPAGVMSDEALHRLGELREWVDSVGKEKAEFMADVSYALEEAAERSRNPEYSALVEEIREDYFESGRLEGWLEE